MSIPGAGSLPAGPTTKTLGVDHAGVVLEVIWPLTHRTYLGERLRVFSI